MKEQTKYTSIRWLKLFHSGQTNEHAFREDKLFILCIIFFVFNYVHCNRKQREKKTCLLHTKIKFRKRDCTGTTVEFIHA